MKSTTELTRALAAYLKTTVAQPVSDDASPIMCADCAYMALPKSSATLAQVLPYTDEWLLERATVNESYPDSLERHACVNTMIEASHARRAALELAYRLAGGGLSPESAAHGAFLLFQRLHELWCTEVAAHELQLMGITDPELVRERAQQEISKRKQEAE